MHQVTRTTIRLEESYPYWYMKYFRNGQWSTICARWTSREAAIADLDLVTAGLEKRGYQVVKNLEVDVKA